MQLRKQTRQIPHYPPYKTPRSGKVARIVVGVIITLSMAGVLAMLAITIG